MRLLSPVLVKAYSNRIMNIHPALLPAFPGLHGQKQALEYGVRFAGCTVHFVNEECDQGPIIIQAAVPAYPDDTEETLSARILKAEHRIYPRAIQLYSEGRLRVEGRKVFIDRLAKDESSAWMNPPPEEKRGTGPSSSPPASWASAAVTTASIARTTGFCAISRERNTSPSARKNSRAGACRGRRKNPAAAERRRR